MTYALEASLAVHSHRMFGVNSTPAEREREREGGREKLKECDERTSTIGVTRTYF